MNGFEHYDEELIALSERIGRLAIGCAVDLNVRENIVSIIRGDLDVCRRGDPHRRRELRGLIRLMYRIEQHCIATLGPDECRRLVEAEEASLRRRGFRGFAMFLPED